MKKIRTMELSLDDWGLILGCVVDSVVYAELEAKKRIRDKHSRMYCMLSINKYRQAKEALEKLMRAQTRYLNVDKYGSIVVK